MDNKNTYAVKRFEIDTPKKDDPASQWLYRYSRSGNVPYNIKSEDERFIEEHLANSNKNKNFNFDKLKTQKFEFVGSEKFKNFSDFKDNFTDFKIHSQLQDNVKKLQFANLTPIQKYAFPVLFENTDIIACAETGSGKTLAFLLPVINQMLQNGVPETSKLRQGCSYPICLVLAPTRELAEQIYKEARKLLYLTGIIVTKVYGGVAYDEQIRSVKSGCDILVATPGRLIDFLDKQFISLKYSKYLVLDEADRMLDMGFEKQLNQIICTYDIPSKENRNNMMFSATFEQQVQKIARKFINNYCFITNGEKANKNIVQLFSYVDNYSKLPKLHKILQRVKGSVIIFVEKKRDVDYLLNQMLQGNYNAIGIHGDIPQPKRDSVIEQFKTGDVPILIATDVASRGLDFPQVSFVFNFDMPSNIDSYVHRIGRTGRCGNKGVAISFLNDKDKQIIYELTRLLKKNNQDIPNWFSEMGRSGRGYRGNNYHNSKNNYDNY